MCNRYWVDHQVEKIAERYSVRRIRVTDHGPLQLFPDKPKLMIRLNDDGERELEMAQWGLVPPWVKDEDLATFIRRTAPNNARDDTIRTNLENKRGMFYPSMKSRRCLLPASAWCEWTGEKGSKVANRLSVVDRPLFVFAGMWTYRENPGPSCTMVTTDAIGKAAEYHSRIPVVLRDEDVDAWLDPASNPMELTALFQPLSDEELEVVALGQGA